MTDYAKIRWPNAKIDGTGRAIPLKDTGRPEDTMPVSLKEYEALLQKAEAERELWRERFADAAELLAECAEFLDGQADADYDGERFMPNEAGSLKARVDYLLAHKRPMYPSTPGVRNPHDERLDRDENPGSRCGPGCGYCGRCT